MKAKVKTKITVESILKFLTDSLQCSQKIVASYTGLNESTLSANLAKPITELATKKTGKRLLSLYFVVHHFSEKGLAAEIIKESLNEFAYEDLDGNTDSVVTAIHGDKYQTELLINIAQLGCNQYLTKLSQRDSLYSTVKSLSRAI